VAAVTDDGGSVRVAPRPGQFRDWPPRVLSPPSGRCVRNWIGIVHHSSFIAACLMAAPNR
jgi:hypothetical protein